MNAATNWTDEEIRFLEDNYADMPNDELARKFNRSRVAVVSQAYRLGIRKPKCEYALYKGDKLLAVGTADELAKLQGVHRTTIWNYATPYSRVLAEKNKDYTYAVKLEAEA